MDQTQNQTYERLLSLCNDVVKCYRTDLTVHDRNLLKNFKRRFLHFSGSTGTNLFPLLGSDDYPGKNEIIPYLFSHATRWEIVDDTYSMVRAMKESNRQDLILYFDGEEFQKITQKEAESIFYNHMQVLFEEWKKQ